MRVRRLILVIIALLLAWPWAVSAQRTVKYEQLTVDGTVRQIATATLANMRTCQAVLEQAEIRYRNDGTDPTTTVGTPLGVGGTLEIANVVDGANLKFIRTGGTSGILNIHCWP